MKIPTFKITETNNRLLFNYAASKLSKEESLIVTNLIQSDEHWREYYIDMKRLYDEYGEAGLDVPMEKEISHSKISSHSSLKWTIVSYRGQILRLIQEYRNAATETSNTKSILLELIDIAESIDNIPDFEVANLGKEYSITIRHLINSINEIINSKYGIQEEECIYTVPELHKIEKLMAHKGNDVFISARTHLVQFLTDQGVIHRNIDEHKPVEVKHEYIDN